MLMHNVGLGVQIVRIIPRLAFLLKGHVGENKVA
jgi:hypothetical protein